MDGVIASPNWEACKTCKHQGDNGCILSIMGLTVYLGDLIICDDYENNQKIQATEESPA